VKPCEIEELVRERLETMLGKKLRKGKLILRCNTKRQPQIHEFDLISEDMSVIGEVKSGKHSMTNYRSALVDCLYLSRTRVPRKLMVFTNKQLCEYFRRSSEGLVSRDIDVIFVDVKALGSSQSSSKTLTC
jgi:hypothetical protein